VRAGDFDAAEVLTGAARAVRNPNRALPGSSAVGKVIDLDVARRRMRRS
jgi:hypothetical protein